MAQIISGTGQYPPRPQFLYPSELYNAPIDTPSNEIQLAAGAVLPIPAGNWMLRPGPYTQVQWLDPITGIWRLSSANSAPSRFIQSNGQNWRIANLTGCAVSAVIAGGGSGFSSSTATITANVGGSTWSPIVGGSLSVSTVNVGGSGFTVPPLVLISAPPFGGIPATAYATLASNTVASVSLTNFGAGYLTAPNAVLVPSPADPNFGSIKQASVTLVLNAATSTAITGALCTNNGAALATISALTLTAAGGAGSGATITPVVMQVMTGGSVVAAGAGFTGGALLTTVGGVPASVSAIVNPAVELTNFIPRQAQALMAVGTGTLVSISAIYDAGLFVHWGVVVHPPAQKRDGFLGLSAPC